MRAEEEEKKGKGEREGGDEGKRREMHGLRW